MSKFDVLRSFAKATLVHINDSEDEGTTSSGSSDGYGGPGHANGILAPYNFSFS